MKTKIIVILWAIFISKLIFSQPRENASYTVWSSHLKSLNYFIENKGQFPDIEGEKVLFAYLGNREKYYLTPDGFIIQLDTIEIRKSPLRVFFDKILKNENEEKERENVKYINKFIHVKWKNANAANINIETDNKSDYYFTFTNFYQECYGFKKITYRNIYPNIDVEYIIPDNFSVGIKYNIILHPYSNPDNISLIYSGDVKSLSINHYGELVIENSIHSLKDKLIKSYYLQNPDSLINSSFIVNGNEVKFFVDRKDENQSIIIDPWLSGINLSGDDYGYDVEYDFDGNLYVYMRETASYRIVILKFSPAGNLIWSHIVISNYTYDGNFLLDKLANKMYVSEGFNGGGARAYRLNLNGVADGFWSQQNGSFREMWDMIFDCKMNRIIGVGGGTNSNLNGGLINPSNGAVSTANFTGVGGTCQDVVNGTVDNYGNVYVFFAVPTDGASMPVANKLMLLNPTLNGYIWSVNHGMYSFQECSNHHFISSPCDAYNSNAYNALDVNDSYLYMYDGRSLKAFDPQTGNAIAATSVGFSGQWYAPLSCGGIAVDDCNNIYVGGPNGNLLHYTFNGTSFSAPQNIPIGWPLNFVLDVKLDKNLNLLYVSGNNGVAVIHAAPSSTCYVNFVDIQYSCTGGGMANLTANVSTNLSNPVFNYTWYDINNNIIAQTNNSSSPTNSLNNVPNGTYIVKVHVNPFCGPILYDTLTFNCPICSGTTSSIDVSCYGGNDGQASITPNGGQPPYTYLWSNNDNHQTITGLSAGNYTVTLTDANNCTVSYTVTITQPNPLQLNIIPFSVICNGGNDGQATVYPTGGTPPYSYSWSNGQNFPTANNLQSGTYSVTVTDNNNCTISGSVNITEPAPLVVSLNASPLAVCPGDSITLTAQGAVLYQWQPSTYLSSDTGSIVTFSSLQPGTYNITATGYVPHIGNNLIQNGDFELGNAYFNSSYVYNNTIIGEGMYSITDNPNNVHPQFSLCSDHSLNGNNMMVVNGSSIANVDIWCQNIPVIPNTNYIFSAWITSVHPDNPAILQFSINGNLVGNPFQATPNTCDWQQFFELWNSGTNTTANICITNQNTILQGNDFALDDIYFAPIVYCSDQEVITLTVNPLPNISISGSTPICEGQSTTLTANGGVGYIWDTGNNSNNITVSPTINTTYQVTGTDANGCSNTASFAVTVIPMPNANAGPDISVCGLSYQLNATPSLGNGSWSSLQNVSIVPVNDPNATLTVNQTGTYTLIWTEDNQGCIDSDTVLISLTKIPTSEFTIDSIACFGNQSTIQFTGYAETNSIYAWNFDGGNVMPGTGPGPHLISWNTPGIHTISLTVSTNGCASTPTLLQIYNPSPLVSNLSKTDVLCYGESTGNIDLMVNGGRQPYSYHWNNGSFTEDLSNVPAGNYTVTITDASGCTQLNAITIHQPSQLVATITPSQYICIGQPAYLTLTAIGGTSPYQYYWNGQLSSASQAVFPQVTTSYTGSVVDANGCSSQLLQTTVYVAPPINVNLLANTDKVCPGDPVMLTPVIWGGVGPPYVIYNNMGEVVIPPIYIYPNENGWYGIRVEDACGSWDTAQVYIQVYPLPPINILADILQGCVPLTVQFNEINPDSGQTYLWNFGDMSNLSLSKNPVHTYTSPGVFDVTITVTSINGCKNTVVYNDLINVWPKPNAKFIWSPELVTEIKPEIQFTNLSTGASWYQWMFGDGDSSSIVNPYHRYPGVGEYQVQLVAVSNKGCKDTVYAVIKVLEQYTFYAPTAFSPDGDKINDFFYIIAHGIKEEGFELNIYDRWGEIIWSTQKFYKDLERSEKWDGRAKNHEIVPVGTYTWRCVFRDNYDKTHEEVGAVNIIR